MHEHSPRARFEVSSENQQSCIQSSMTILVPTKSNYTGCPNPNQHFVNIDQCSSKSCQYRADIVSVLDIDYDGQGEEESKSDSGEDSSIDGSNSLASEDFDISILKNEEETIPSTRAIVKEVNTSDSERDQPLVKILKGLPTLAFDEMSVSSLEDHDHVLSARRVQNITKPLLSVALHQNHQIQNKINPVVTIPVPSSKKGGVLPCFNLVCTGTCAYGPKCTFLHDPRAQLPKTIRRQAEFLLQAHLHTYRPNTQKTMQLQGYTGEQIAQQGLKSRSDTLTSSETDGECSTIASVNGTFTTANGKKLSIAYKKDDIFEFPAFPMNPKEANAKCYDPSDEELNAHSREMSMWYHLLAYINEKRDIYPSRKHLAGKRLPVFQQLANTGKSVNTVNRSPVGNGFVPRQQQSVTLSASTPAFTPQALKQSQQQPQHAHHVANAIASLTKATPVLPPQGASQFTFAPTVQNVNKTAMYHSNNTTAL